MNTTINTTKRIKFANFLKITNGCTTMSRAARALSFAYDSSAIFPFHAGKQSSIAIEPMRVTLTMKNKSTTMSEGKVGTGVHSG